MYKYWSTLLAAFFNLLAGSIYMIAVGGNIKILAGAIHIVAGIIFFIVYLKQRKLDRLQKEFYERMLNKVYGDKREQTEGK